MKHSLPITGSGDTRAEPPKAETPDWTNAPKDRTEKVKRALYEIRDPELPISIMDLGLIYSVEVTQQQAHIEMTFTAMGCPCLNMIQGDIRQRLQQIDQINQVNINTVWEPPWTTDRITPRGKKQLQKAGVSL